MTSSRTCLALCLFLLAGLLLRPSEARAETYHTCAGFIDTIPMTVATQGVWCLSHDLSTSITSGAAITIATNNVTIDCNGFKIGGLAAGDGSATRGIFADDRLNVTVRNCGIRGFLYGIYIKGGSGHLVEDNRLDNNLFVGIYLPATDNSLVQRNRVFDTGGAAGSDASVGIQAQADVLDNTVSGVFGTQSSATYPRGIFLGGIGNRARGNRVSGLVVAGTGFAYAMQTYGSGNAVEDNYITANATTNGVGIFGNVHTVCRNNTVVNFTDSYLDCASSVGDVSLP